MNMSKGSEREDFEWAVKVQRASLEVAGIWPKVQHKRRKRFNDLWVLIECVVLLFACLIPCAYALLKNISDIQAVVDNLQFLVSFSIIVPKLIVIHCKKKSLIPMINMIANDWSKPKPNSERNVMIRRSQVARILTVSSYLMFAFCFLMVTTLPAFGIRFRYLSNATDLGRMLPIQSYYPFDVTASPIYEITFVSQAIGFGVGGTCISAVDHLMVLFIFHISGQMENLRNRFARILDAKDFDEALAFNVKDHIRLIRAIDIVENTYTLLLLGVLLFFAIFVCVYGTLMITIFNKGTDVSILRLIYVCLVLACVFLHTFVTFLLGEILVNESELIYRTICENEWENLEAKQAKNMILLMIRTKKPIYLTAGKIVPLTLPTFCSILKISASYISFLMARLE